eukprot:scaffold6765_cov97-Skeletonema_menzelii.AAC.1
MNLVRVVVLGEFMELHSVQYLYLELLDSTIDATWNHRAVGIMYGAAVRRLSVACFCRKSLLPIP